jgi:hypothetical protein
MKRRGLASVGSLILAAAILGGLSGCDLAAPQDTLNIKEVADGVNGSVAGITIGDAVLISTDGKTANLIVTFVNEGTENRSVEVKKGRGSPQAHSVPVPPGDPVIVGLPGHPLIVFTELGVIPGSIYPVYFTVAGATGDLLDVPVLDGRLPQYKDLTPDKVRGADQQSSLP